MKTPIELGYRYFSIKDRRNDTSLFKLTKNSLIEIWKERDNKYYGGVRTPKLIMNKEEAISIENDWCLLQQDLKELNKE